MNEAARNTTLYIGDSVTIIPYHEHGTLLIQRGNINIHVGQDGKICAITSTLFRQQAAVDVPPILSPEVQKGEIGFGNHHPMQNPDMRRVVVAAHDKIVDENERRWRR